MNITELKHSLWEQEAIPTEYMAFKSLCANPIDTDAHYVAAPWSVLINTRKKFFKNELDLKVENGFTICQHISYADIIPFLKNCGVTTLFTPHATLPQGGITILPFPHHAVNGTDPGDKSILCSFVGCLFTHQTRKVIWNTKPDRDDVRIIKRSMWHYEAPNQLDRQAEYKRILARSRFSLCPRGTGASTIRFWESLQAGAIPILISDAMRLPDGWDWPQTIIRIPESKVVSRRDRPNWIKIIERITPEGEQLMRDNCLGAYKSFSGNNLVSNIRLHFRGNTEDIPAVS